MKIKSAISLFLPLVLYADC